MVFQRDTKLQNTQRTTCLRWHWRNVPFVAHTKLHNTTWTTRFSFYTNDKGDDNEGMCHLKHIYYSKYYKGQCLVLCSSENCMGVSNIHIFCPLTNWYCKITSNSTWFWHEIRIFIFKFCTLRPKRNAIFTEKWPYFGGLWMTEQRYS